MKIKNCKLIIIALTIFSLSGNILFANVSSGTIDTERAQLEAELAELERQMDEQRGLIQEKQREASTFERDITILDAQIRKVKIGIRARDISVGNLNSGIKDRTVLIDDYEQKTDEAKVSFSLLLPHRFVAI